MKTKNIVKRTLQFSTLLSLVVMASCQEEQFFQKNNLEQEAKVNEPDDGQESDPIVEPEPEPEPEPPKEEPEEPEEEEEPVISCDPFTDGTSDEEYSANNGITGKLYYAPDEKYKYVDDYFKDEHKMGVKLLFNQINVPTRRFNRGFLLSDGELLKDKQDVPIFEYFGVDYESSLIVTMDDEEGYYELATLADDGVKVSVPSLNQPDQMEPIIERSYQTATRMTCSTRMIYLEKGDLLPIRMKYFQGPKTEIASVLMWRKIENPSTYSPGLDESCGRSGTHTFFNPADSEPSNTYKALLERGWEPIPAKHFYLGNEENVCNKKEEEEPQA